MLYFKRLLWLIGIGLASASFGQVLQQGAPQSNFLESSALLNDVVEAVKAGQQQAEADAKRDAAKDGRGGTDI